MIGSRRLWDFRQGLWQQARGRGKPASGDEFRNTRAGCRKHSKDAEQDRYGVIHCECVQTESGAAPRSKISNTGHSFSKQGLHSKDHMRLGKYYISVRSRNFPPHLKLRVLFHLFDTGESREWGSPGTSSQASQGARTHDWESPAYYLALSSLREPGPGAS